MPYATEKARLGRVPLTVVEIDLDFCEWSYADRVNCQADVISGQLAADSTNHTSGLFGYCTLDSAASSTDDAYKSMVIVAGSETRSISAYNGTTKVCTVTPAWTSPPPSGTAYAIYDSQSANACYNTRSTCQDTQNYSRITKTYRFCQPRSDLPVGVDMYPCIIGEVADAPMKITPGQGIGYRASVSIALQDFPHHDRGVDPYVANRSYNAEQQGTFFGKLLARNQYYESRELRVLTGYITEPFDWANFKAETYVITDIVGPTNGVVQIKAKDILQLADDKKSKMPLLSDGTLAADLDASSTSFTLSLGSTVYASGKYLRIGDEIVGPVTVSGSSVTGATRATWGTEAKTHKQGDLVQICEAFEGVNAVDVVDYILNNYVPRFNTAWIPYDQGISGPATGVNDEWDDEKQNWLSQHDLTAIISKPEGVTKLLAEISSQCLFDLWWDAQNNKLKLKAVAPELGNASIQSVNDDEHLIADSVKVKRDTKQRLSRVIVHYEKINHAGDDKAENYRKATIKIDANTEGDDFYRTESSKVFFSRWFSNGNAGQALQLQGRLLARYSDTPLVVDFELDAKDDLTPVGSNVQLNTREIQGNDGAIAPHQVQVVARKEKQQGHKVWYQGISNNFTGRYGFIAPDGTPDYSAATDDQKKRYGFVCQNDGLFSDGSEGYKII